MILLSCPRCSRQYDVTHLPPRSKVRCVCDERFDVTWSRPFVVARLQCATCAGPVERGDASCRYCDTPLPEREREMDSLCPRCFARIREDSRHCRACGVEIRPQALSPVPDGRSCPRCEGELGIRILEEVSVVECASCGGLWIEAAVFDSLCARARGRRDAGGRPARRATIQERPAAQVRYVPCLACGELMFRRQFRHAGRASGIVIDRCKDHGAWLDKDELEAVAAFLATEDSRERPVALADIPGLDEALRRSASESPSRGRRPKEPQGLESALAFVADLFLGDLFG